MNGIKHWKVTQEHSFILLRSNWTSKRVIAFRNWDEVAEIVRVLIAAIPREEGSPTDDQPSALVEIVDALDEMTPWAEVGITESFKQGGLSGKHYEIALDELDEAQKLLKKCLGDSWHSR